LFVLAVVYFLVQRGSIPGAPNAIEFSGGFIGRAFSMELDSLVLYFSRFSSLRSIRGSGINQRSAMNT